MDYYSAESLVSRASKEVRLMTCFKYRLKDQLEVTAKCESPTPTSSGCFLDLGIFAFFANENCSCKKNVEIQTGTEEQASKAQKVVLMAVKWHVCKCSTRRWICWYVG